jgi:threonine aldolase
MAEAKRGQAEVLPEQGWAARPTTRPRLDFRDEMPIRPTEGMWRAMRAAFDFMDLSSSGADPIVRELERVGAELTGKEASYLMPSTTSAALCAFLAMDTRGKLVVMESRAHLWWHQRFHFAVHAGGAPLVLSGDKYGALDPDLVLSSIRRSASGQKLETGAICLENTHNICGGTVLTPGYTQLMSELAHDNGANLFLDGARIFNSAVAQGVAVRSLTLPADAVAISLNKAVGAPYGALLCASLEIINRARAEARRLGANQVHKSGMLAAAALEGLKDVEQRASVDHNRLRRLAAGLRRLPGIRIDSDTVQTNLLRVDVADLGLTAAEAIAILRDKGVGVKESEPTVVRLVTHSGINDIDIDQVLEVFADLTSRTG